MFDKLFQDKFLRHNFIYFCGSMIVAVFNYLYYPVLSRMMDIGSFGEVQAFISLFLILSMVAGMFQTVVVNIAANAEEIKEKHDLILMLEKVVLYVVLLISLLIIIFSPQLKSFLKFDSIYPFIALAILLLLDLFFTFRIAILQGLHKFKELSISNIYLSAGRLFFAILLVSIGWAVFGAVMAVVIAQIMALIYAYSKTKDHLASLTKARVKITNQVKKEIRYALLVFLATSCIAFLYTADVIVVKHYFSADQAGLYSGVSTIARIILFFTSSVGGVLLSHVKLDNSPKENSKILKKSIFLVGGLGGVVLLTFFIFPDIIIKILIGQKYLSYSFLLPRLSIVLFMVSIISLIFNYYLALRKYFLSIISILGPLLIIILSYFWHKSPSQIVYNFLWGSAIMLLILLSSLLWQSLKFKQNKIYG